MSTHTKSEIHFAIYLLLKNIKSLQPISVRRVKKIHGLVRHELSIGIGGENESRIAPGVDVHADQALAVKRLIEDRVEIHVIPAKLCQAFLAKQIF